LEIKNLYKSMKNSYYHIGGIFFGLMLTAVSNNTKAQIHKIASAESRKKLLKIIHYLQHLQRLRQAHSDRISK
ncbi:hypothetical protein, partial [Chryseobacterium mucoviscidosis]|uniref:hypothetical protein n=1 Tax=Chryseobacterium mucoviscidosis TaxID=1945581 RepID=UPI00301B296D